MPASRQPVSKPAHAGRLLIFIEVFFEDYFVIFNELVFVGNVFSFKLEIGIYSIAGCQLSGGSCQGAVISLPLYPVLCRPPVGRQVPGTPHLDSSVRGDASLESVTVGSPSVADLFNFLYLPLLPIE